MKLEVRIPSGSDVYPDRCEVVETWVKEDGVLENDYPPEDFRNFVPSGGVYVPRVFLGGSASCARIPDAVRVGSCEVRVVKAHVDLESLEDLMAFVEETGEAVTIKNGILLIHDDCQC